jgi:hypothetical protein
MRRNAPTNRQGTYKCHQCRKDKALSEFHSRADRGRGHETRCKDCHAQWSSQFAQGIRTQVLAKFGGKCSACGFSDRRALQLDHVNSGGSRECREIGTVGVMRRALADTTGKYQLLCANCNWIKRWEKNEMRRTLPVPKVIATVDGIAALRLFVSGVSMPTMKHRLGAQRVEIIEAMRTASKVPWVDVAWVRRMKLRAYRLKGPQTRKAERVAQITNMLLDNRPT